jgi:hypothetical protein
LAVPAAPVASVQMEATVAPALRCSATAVRAVLAALV